MSRPKGSKNRPKIRDTSTGLEETKKSEIEVSSINIKRGRGRPRKNPIIYDDELEIEKDNLISPTLLGNNKDVKREIRKLRKLKLACRAGSEERIALHRQIKELKKRKAEITTAELGKEIPIGEILRLENEYKIKPRFEDIGIDLYKYTLKELEHHLERLKKKYTQTC